MTDKSTDFLLKLKEGDKFKTIGGFRSTSFNHDSDMDSQTLDEASVYGTGVFMDDAAFATVEQTVRTRAIKDMQVIVPQHGIYEGKFLITSLWFGGESNGELTYALSLQSKDAIEFKRTLTQTPKGDKAW